jgi:Putative restriction endonuclease
LTIHERNRPHRRVERTVRPAHAAGDGLRSTVLFVEVCESSLRYDRVVKAHRYAQAGIADYWIVNPIDRQLEVYRNPEPDSERRGRFHYLM